MSRKIFTKILKSPIDIYKIIEGLFLFGWVYAGFYILASGHLLYGKDPFGNYILLLRP